MSLECLRHDLLLYCHKVYEKGWVANHDGNLTARLSDGTLLCTPTAVSKGDVTAEMLIVVNNDNVVIEGTRKSFSELQLHRAAYTARPEVGCVIHAHPPTATGFAVANIPIGHPFMAEPVVSLGSEIPLVPFYPPKDPALDQAIAAGLAVSDVLLLANHGVLAVGANFEQAFLRLELLEHIAGIALVARQLGGAVELDAQLVQSLSARGRPSSSPTGEPTKILNNNVDSSQKRPDVRDLVESSLRKWR